MASWTRQLRRPGGSVGDTQNPDGRVVAELEQPSGVVERRQLLPASPHSAGSGDAMTLTCCLQSAFHCLKEGGGGEEFEMSVP